MNKTIVCHPKHLSNGRFLNVLFEQSLQNIRQKQTITFQYFTIFASF